MGLGWIWVGILISAAASFLFALAETALFSLGILKIRTLASRGSKRADLVRSLLETSQELLASLVLGNVMANVLIVILAMQLVLWHDWSFWTTLPPLFLFILVACEVLPKTLAVRNPERWSLAVVGLIAVFHRLTLPLLRVVQKVNNRLLRLLLPSSWQPKAGTTDEEYEELIELAAHQGMLGRSEKEMISNIIQLDRRTAADVMKPRAQMSAIADDLSIEEMIVAAREYQHRRLPIYNETPDTIVGILNTQKFLLDPHADLSEVVDFPSFVPESMNLLQLMKSLQRQKRGLAVVLDEFGGTAGLVALEDIVEEIVGEMNDSSRDPEPIATKIGENRWQVEGGFRIEDFCEYYPYLGEVAVAKTLGGLLVHLVGIVPSPGAVGHFRGLKMTALKVDDRRVLELLVEISGKK